MEFCNKKSDVKCLFIFDVAMPTVNAVRFAQKDHLIEFVACEQAHLIGKGGGAAIASRRNRREEWGEEK